MNMFMSNTYDLFLELAMWLMLAVAFIAAASFVTKGVIDIVLTIIIEAPTKTVRAIVDSYKASSKYLADIKSEQKQRPSKKDSSVQNKTQAKPNLDDLSAPTYIRWNKIPQELKNEHNAMHSSKNKPNYRAKRNIAPANQNHANFVNDAENFDKDSQIKRRNLRRQVSALKGKTYTSKGVVMD